MKIAFYKWKWDWLDRLIRWGTASKYSHCEIIVWHNTCFWSSYRDGWVRTKIINLNSWNWDILEMEVSDELLSKIMATQTGKKYDLKWILFSQLLKVNHHNPDKWFCSEIIAFILGYKEPESYSPWDLYGKINRCIYNETILKPLEK